MTNRPDPELVFGYLHAGERAVIHGWLEELELAPDAWPEACPPLATLLPILATLRAADDVAAERPKLSRGDAIRRGAEVLGIEDDDRRATHPADSILRLLRDWRARGRNLRPSTEDAA